jgi:hypothetical protein
MFFVSTATTARYVQLKRLRVYTKNLYILWTLERRALFFGRRFVGQILFTTTAKAESYQETTEQFMALSEDAAARRGNSSHRRFCANCFEDHVISAACGLLYLRISHLNTFFYGVI